MNAALAEERLAPFSAEDYKYFVGNGARRLVERALTARNALSEDTFERVYTRYTAYYDRSPNAKSAPYDGVEELLKALTERGVACAVLSNKPDEATRAVIENFFSYIPFAAVHGGRDGIPLKPAPESALSMLEECGGASPSEVIYVGDTAVDMKTGKAAGFFTVGVLWGFRTRAELEQNGADAIVSHPKEILAFL
jgi:phosphoglycolate phosphatase